MPTTVTGSIRNLATNPVTSSSNAFVRLWLRGTRGNTPRITGTGAIAPQVQGSLWYVDLPADGAGDISGTVYSTRDISGINGGDIEAGGSTTAVWYGMVVYSDGVPGPEVPIHAKSGATLDISNVTPITTLPVVDAPTGDATYARVDGGNTPFTGPVTFASYFQGNAKVLNNIRFADEFSSIQAAINDLPATGGIVYLPSGITNLSATININKPVILQGHGRGGGEYYGTPVASSAPTILNWTGTSGDTVLKFSAVSGASNGVLQGSGIRDCTIFGNSLAGIGIQLLSVRGGLFQNLYIDNTTDAAIDTGVVATLAETKDVQDNLFSNIFIGQGVTLATVSSHGIRLRGDNVANTSLNTFQNIHIFHKNGHAIYELGADNNRWFRVSVNQLASGTGKGVYLTSDANGKSYEEAYFGLEAGPGGLTQDGNSTANAVYGYTTSNGAPDPTISAGSFQWTEQGGSTENQVLHLIRSGGSLFPYVIQMDTSTAGKAVSQAFFDAGSLKWIVQKGTSNDFVVFDQANSLNRVECVAGTNADTVINGSGTGSVLVNALKVASGGTQLKQVRLFSGVAVDAGSIAATSRGSIAVTISGTPGIASGDVIIPVQGINGIDDDLIFEGVTATGTDQVTFFFYNPTASPIDDTSHNWDILWMDVT